MYVGPWAEVVADASRLHEKITCHTDITRRSLGFCTDLAIHWTVFTLVVYGSYIHSWGANEADLLLVARQAIYIASCSTTACRIVVVTEAREASGGSGAIACRTVWYAR